jgi:serine/threonine protein kinase/formylglycine-generating enzyme required for sulfatase activity
MATPPETPSLATWAPVGSSCEGPAETPSLATFASIDPPAGSLDTMGSFDPGWHAPPAESTLALPPRYRWEKLLGRGGMGEVHRVWDGELERAVALKVLYGARALSPEAWEVFLREARLTAGLQHPGIIPVYDLGVLPDGRAWYTMREVQGQSLTADWSQPPADAPDLRRRVLTLVRICEAVGYAHDHVGAVHRDLKPDNVMRGPFGEVLVLDWGLAVRTSDPIDSDRISGTPAYMAPEQARADRAAICPATDVWALGGMLVTVLTGRPPFFAESVPALLQLLRANPAAPACPSTDPDERSLWRIVQRALHPDPQQRPPSATDLGRALTGWLDGSERRADALDHVRRADDADHSAHELRARSSALQHQAQHQLAALSPTATESDRRPLWDLEDEASALLDRARDAEDEATHLLRTALVRMPGLSEAMDRLADRFRTAHATAEASGDRRAARRLLSELRAHDVGRHAEYIRGGGHLSLHTHPAGARVLARPFVSEGRRLVPGAPLDLGTTPLREAPIPHGSWVLELHADGRAPGLLPIVVPRGEHVALHNQRPLPLPRTDRLGPQDVYIPPGWFQAGGSEPIVDRPLPPMRRYCPPLIARRFPFTMREMLAWFDRLHREGKLDRALQFCPRAHRSTPGSPEGATVGLGADGRATLMPDQDGDLWNLDWPAIMVTWFGATAIAQDVARWTGLPWRLPAELEWEWLARGADGRVLPWGTAHAEPAWCRARLTNPIPIPAPVHSHPIDCGPSGVRGLAGNVMEWCQENYPDTTPSSEDGVLNAFPADPEQAGTLKNVRGGAYSFAAYLLRSTIRRVQTARNRHFDVGFRLVRPLVDDDWR